MKMTNRDFYQLKVHALDYLNSHVSNTWRDVFTPPSVSLKLHTQKVCGEKVLVTILSDHQCPLMTAISCIVYVGLSGSG